jgi:hypothetical protein
MYQQILEMLLAKYGHLSLSELKAALRNDGLGEFVDAIENDAYLMGMMSEISKELSADLSSGTEFGIIPSTVQKIQGIPVDYRGTFKFDPQACIETCKGNCCKKKNYLMINITDIFRIISSKGAQFFDIRSTRDLFDRKPPFIELFYSEEYRIFLPYIRFLPVDANIQSRPEDAKGSICPFLQPIHEVYAHHKKALPKRASKDAQGCILMEDKPLICRLSPLGKNSGMVTGRVTYEYLPPAPVCPACETDVEMKVSDYVSSVVSLSEQQQEERLHKMLMSYHQEGISPEFDRNHLNEIIKQVYNIDGLLFRYGLGSEYRPQVEQLVEIVFAASRGYFGAYEQFLEDLRNRGKKNGGQPNTVRYKYC